MSLRGIKYQLLAMLTSHRQISREKMKVGDLLTASFPQGYYSNLVDLALREMVEDNFINARFFADRVDCVSITPAGEKFLERLTREAPVELQ